MTSSEMLEQPSLMEKNGESAMTDAVGFWDQVWTQTAKPYILDVDVCRTADPVLQRYLDLVGDVRGKEVLDLGCGNGELSVYLAKVGASVTAVDFSPVSVQNTKTLAEYNDVGAQVSAQVADCMDLAALQKSFDLAVGKDVLHHIEPFDAFVDVLYDALRPGGRGIFFENSARNAVLMFFRSHAVGRFGIPKCSDNEEYPLEPREIAMFRRRFARVTTHYPEFRFFKMLGPYIFRGKKRLGRRFERLDDLVYRYLPMFNKYSYRQIVEVER
jgi:2-polyprenyl-3-methyl-5-hydroxy-6-metoxy-1,4-benzoquinol methylase